MPVDLDPAAAAARVGEPDVGWAYVDQQASCPKLHGLTRLRTLIVKRPSITTVEVLSGPVRGRRKSHLVTGYVHKPYPRIYAMLARHAGFDSALIVRGVEGGVIPSLTHMGKVFQYHDGGEEAATEFRPTELGIVQSLRAPRIPGAPTPRRRKRAAPAAPLDTAAVAKSAAEAGLGGPRRGAGRHPRQPGLRRRTLPVAPRATPLPPGRGRRGARRPRPRQGAGALPARALAEIPPSPGSGGGTAGGFDPRHAFLAPGAGQWDQPSVRGAVMLRRHWVLAVVVVIAALAILLLARGAFGADAVRGAALYESRCGECHATSVHGRAKRVAKDFNDVRGWVNRWNDNLGLHWGDEEIDDVSVYLNNTYYRYACPPTVCKVVSLAGAVRGSAR